MKTNVQDLEIDIFQYLSKSQNDFIFLYDVEENVCRWSTNALQKFAIEENEFSWKRLLHPSDYEKFLHDCQEIQRRHTGQFSGEYRFRLNQGEYIWVQCNGSMVMSPNRDKMLLSGLINILRTKEHFDPITNLKYINSFCDSINSFVAQEQSVGVLIIGIDDFKQINDLYSYAFGDTILKEFVATIEHIMPSSAQLFRLDGDSFGIIYPKGNTIELMELYNAILAEVQIPRYFDNISVSFTISAGIAHYPDDGLDGDTLYRNARMTFAESKRRGVKQISVCSEALCQQIQRRVHLLELLRESVANHCEGFSLRYQPLIKTKDESLYGCEVLMRWKHEDFTQEVSPYEFIPLLEDSGLIFEVNKWLLKNAFEQCAKWITYMPSFHMNINFSYAQFEDYEFKFLIMKMLSEMKLPASAITLELTETGQVTDMNSINNVFNFLRSQGLKIALDDFGVGYSSLSVFQMLKVDQLKIDRSFLQRLTYDVTDQVLVRQLIELCHSINIMVCVEGVDSTQVTEIVRQFGPELLQGFYYNCPLTDEMFYNQYFKERNMLANTSQSHEHLPEFEESMIYSALKPTTPLSVDVIVNNAYGGIFQVAMDENFSFITCNEGYRRMLGYTAQDIEAKFGNRALGIVFSEDIDYVNNEIRRQLGEGDTISIEFRVVRHDGQPIWILGTGNVVKSADGNPSLIVLIIDNDKMKHEQLEVAKRCRRFERILHNLPVGVKCVQNNEDFTLDYMSPAFLSLLGYEEEDLDTLFDRKYVNMVIEEDRPVVMSDVLEQAKTSDIVTLRYRSYCKDSAPIWVETISQLYPPEEDGIQRWYSSVVNITDSITDEQKNHAKDFAGRIQQASRQWGDVMFEYDFATDKVLFSDNYHDLFKRKPQREMLAETASIFPDDRHLLDDAIQLSHKGLQPDAIEVRYYSEERGYFWVSILFTEPEMLANKPVSVIGRISDIDKEKKAKEELLLQSRIDGLTNILNKKSIEKSIRASMDIHHNDGVSFALCVIDVDNFKGFNDERGHMFGDFVLKEISQRLTHIASEHIFVGRAGGDEFMVYARLGQEFGNADQLGQYLIRQLCEPIHYEGECIILSTSIGIAMYPRDSQDFYNLYRKADSALYLVKAKGKANYHVSVSV